MGKFGNNAVANFAGPDHMFHFCSEPAMFARPCPAEARRQCTQSQFLADPRSTRPVARTWSAVSFRPWFGTRRPAEKSRKCVSFVSFAAPDSEKHPDNLFFSMSCYDILQQAIRISSFTSTSSYSPLIGDRCWTISALPVPMRRPPRRSRQLSYDSRGFGPLGAALRRQPRHLGFAWQRWTGSCMHPRPACL